MRIVRLRKGLPIEGVHPNDTSTIIMAHALLITTTMGELEDTMEDVRLPHYVGAQWVGLMLLPIFFTACTTGGQVAVKVDSVSHQMLPINGKRLWVDLNERAGNLFLENQVATKIMHTIAARGYSQAITLADADYRLEFSYYFQKSQKPVSNTPAARRDGNGFHTAIQRSSDVARLFRVECIPTALDR